VIGKVGRGRDVAGLLRYLFGPGRANEHADPHLVASWDGVPRLLEPQRLANGRRDLRRLSGLLDHPVMAAVRPPERPVWHCSVRTAAADRRLSDAEWAQVARDVVARTGLAPDGDDDACRWVAVRHADDHIHIVATLVRQDGRTEAARNDFYRLGEACRSAEETFGLTRTAPRDRTAARAASRAEHEKAGRTRRREPARTTLRRRVRVAAAQAATGEEFLQGLSDAGLLVRPRFSELDGTTLTGYAVALPGDSNGHGQPVWFGGGKLAADLSWPRVSARWPDTAQRGRQPRHEVSGHRVRLTADERATVWRNATRMSATAAHALRRLSGHDPVGAADLAEAAADVMAVTANVVEGRTGGPLTDAAAAFDRASRDLHAGPPAARRLSSAGQGLRAVARLLALTGSAQRDETAQVLALVAALAALADALAALRLAQERAAQAEAATAAARTLRQPRDPVRIDVGRRTPTPVIHSLARTVSSSTDPGQAGPRPARAARR
jgi:hypothetical protein